MATYIHLTMPDQAHVLIEGTIFQKPGSNQGIYFTLHPILVPREVAGDVFLSQGDRVSISGGMVTKKINSKPVVQIDATAIRLLSPQLEQGIH